MSDREFHDAAVNLSVVGPFEEFRVVLNGWVVPHLSAQYVASRDEVEIVLDGRFALDVPSGMAGRVLSFLADTIAVSKGWSCHPNSPEWEPHGWLGENGPGATRKLPWYRLSNLAATGLDLDEGDGHP